MIRPEMEFLTNEDGEPWCCFARGHIDRRTVTREAIKRAMRQCTEEYAEDFDRESPGRPKVEHFYLTNENINDSYEPFDETTWFCEKGDLGAFEATGVKF